MVWVEVAVAATDTERSNKRVSTSLMLAAMALPGLIMPAGVQAESAPEKTTLGIKYLHYKDWQDFDPAQPKRSGQRIKVSSPSAYWLAPVGSSLSIEGSITLDSVSGASPKYHSALSGASSKGYIDDKRKAFDLKVTKYEEHTSYGLGISRSSEHDYESSAISGDFRLNADGNNRTYAFGLSYASDRINAITADVFDERKRTFEFMTGLTQVISPTELGQINLTHSSGRGYFSDPYKNQYGLDIRPDHRRQTALLLRYNKHFENQAATMRTSARYYRDSFGVKGLTLGVDWAQELPQGWTVTPNLRYTTQSSASFYYDPPFTGALPAGSPYYSADSRLSAFGAVTAGVKVEKEIGKASRVDLKVERYEQRSAWRLGGHGSVGILPLKALFWQLGWSTQY
jgi:Protein of unknown function (DUF3570)